MGPSNQYFFIPCHTSFFSFLLPGSIVVFSITSHFINLLWLKKRLEGCPGIYLEPPEGLHSEAFLVLDSDALRYFL